MNILPAQEVKRRGVVALDEALTHGPVHIIKNNRPSCVVLTEDHYRELLELQDEVDQIRLQASLEELRHGRVMRHASADELLRHLDQGN